MALRRKEEILGIRLTTDEERKYSIQRPLSLSPDSSFHTALLTTPPPFFLPFPNRYLPHSDAPDDSFAYFQLVSCIYTDYRIRSTCRNSTLRTVTSYIHRSISKWQLFNLFNFLLLYIISKVSEA